MSTSWGWATGVSYDLNDVVYRSSSFYRCILPHSTSSATNRPPNTTCWSTDPLLSASWDSGRNYSQYDATLYRGYWYLSLTAGNSGNNPGTSSSNWAIAPRSLAAWDSTRNYSIDDLISYSGAWYRCIKNHTNQTPTNATYWITMAGSTCQWSAATAYTTSSYVNYGGVWYHCISASTGNTPNNATYWTALGAPVIYAEGTATLPDGTSTIKPSCGLRSPRRRFP